MMLQFALICAAGFVALLVLDRLLGPAMRLLEPMFPNEVVGLDGWFVDTRGGTGIFDRKTRCARS